MTLLEVAFFRQIPELRYDFFLRNTDLLSKIRHIRIVVLLKDLPVERIALFLIGAALSEIRQRPEAGRDREHHGCKHRASCLSISARHKGKCQHSDRRETCHHSARGAEPEHNIVPDRALRRPEVFIFHRYDGIRPGGTGPGLPCSGIIAPVKCVAAAFHMSAVVRPARALLVEVPACVSLAPGIPLFKFTHQACPLLLGELLFRIGLDRFLDLIRHIRIIICTDCLVYNIEDFVNSREKIVRTAHLSHLIYRTCRCRSLMLRKAEVFPPEVIVLTPSGSQPPGPRCGSEHIGNQRSPVRIQEGE